MLRAIVLGILVASAAPACSKEGEAPAVSAHAVAGKVVAISGKVEAVREGKTRELAMGADIFGDDEVIVSADGSVGIDLAHNNARWTLEAGRRGKVRDSAAWTMAKIDTPTKPVEHATSAAGREGERSAATTSTTTAEVSAAAPAAARDDEDKKAAPPPAKSQRETGASKSKPDLDKLEALNKTTLGGRGDVDGTVGTATTRAPTTRSAPPPSPTPPPPPPPPPMERPTDADAPAPSPTPAPRAPTSPSSPSSVEVDNRTKLETLLLAQKPTLQRCEGAAGLTVKLTAERGAASVKVIGGTASEATLKCMDRALKQLKLISTTAVSVELKL